MEPSPDVPSPDARYLHGSSAVDRPPVTPAQKATYRLLAYLHLRPLNADTEHFSIADQHRYTTVERSTIPPSPDPAVDPDRTPVAGRIDLLRGPNIDHKSTDRAYTLTLRTKSSSSNRIWQCEHCLKVGVNKTYTRADHLERHSNQKHRQDSPSFRCWACSRSFWKPEGLRQHLGDHDGASLTNRYVASLDKNSQFYDPDWQGALTEDGFPIRQGVRVIQCPADGCTLLFHWDFTCGRHRQQDHPDPEMPKQAPQDPEPLADTAP